MFNPTWTWTGRSCWRIWKPGRTTIFNCSSTTNELLPKGGSRTMNCSSTIRYSSITRRSSDWQPSYRKWMPRRGTFSTSTKHPLCPFPKSSNSWAGWERAYSKPANPHKTNASYSTMNSPSGISKWKAHSLRLLTKEIKLIWKKSRGWSSTTPKISWGMSSTGSRNL